MRSVNGCPQRPQVSGRWNPELSLCRCSEAVSEPGLGESCETRGVRKTWWRMALSLTGIGIGLTAYTTSTTGATGATAKGGSPSTTATPTPTKAPSIQVSTVSGCTPSGAASCAPKTAMVAITPTHQIAGRPFVIAGNDCPPPMTVTGAPGASPRGPAFQQHADGTWSLKLSFPLGDRSDQGSTASCVNPKSGKTVFTYPQRIQFIVSTPEYLTLLGPRSYAPGSRVSVAPVGALCRWNAQFLAIGLTTIHVPVWQGGSGSLLPVNSPATFKAAGGNSWQATFKLPATLQPGRYHVQASCEESDGGDGHGWGASYMPVELTVS
jgi:hypothetical protein